MAPFPLLAQATMGFWALVTAETTLTPPVTTAPDSAPTRKIKVGCFMEAH
jgi:hypothetical protein